MLEQLIKHRNKLLKQIDEYNFDPNEVVQALDLILRCNEEIRIMQRIKTYQNRILNKKTNNTLK